MPLVLNPEPMFKYACHEVNYSMSLMLARQRNLKSNNHSLVQTPSNMWTGGRA